MTIYESGRIMHLKEVVMKKILLLVMIFSVMICPGAMAAEGKLDFGLTGGQFTGMGVTTSYFGACVLYGLMDQLDLDVRYESGSSSGLTLNIVHIGGDLNIPLGGKTTPFANFGLDLISGVIPGVGQDSNTGYSYGAGIKHKLASEIIVLLEIKGHTSTYMGVTDTVSTVGAGILFEL